LLAATARNVGLMATLAAALCLTLPGSLPLWLYLVALGCLVVCAVALWRLPDAAKLPSVTVIAVFGLAVVVAPIFAAVPLNMADMCAAAIVAGGVVASVCFVLISTRNRYPLVALLFGLCVVAVMTTQITTGSLTPEPLVLVLAGWTACGVAGLWLGHTTLQTLRRIESASQAYLAERQASQTEARRRQGARLLHDTVLATLTLLAHSGVGVGSDALKLQAADDSALLRQLRLGYTPTPQSSGDYKLQPVEESTLGNTLRSVKQRFERLGLAVNWHGTGHVLLPADTLDAFLLALAECLENVRRHAGVDEAHVTITDDDTAVRAMVTDAGVGFNVAEIGAERLGFTESIVARLEDVGGGARLFSSPGSGTTVVLEVPK